MVVLYFSVCKLKNITVVIDFLCGNRSGHQNIELKTQKRVNKRHKQRDPFFKHCGRISKWHRNKLKNVVHTIA